MNGKRECVRDKEEKGKGETKNMETDTLEGRRRKEEEGGVRVEVRSGEVRRCFLRQERASLDQLKPDPSEAATTSAVLPHLPHPHHHRRHHCYLNLRSGKKRGEGKKYNERASRRKSLWRGGEKKREKLSSCKNE